MTASALPAATASRQDRYPSRRPGQEAALLPRLDPVPGSSTQPGPLDDSACRRFARDGFLILPGLLDEDEVARLLARCNALAERLLQGDDERAIREPQGRALRSIFQVQALDPQLAALFADPRLCGAARQLLASEVYLHQTRVNFKPGFHGKEFSWHSDFETWHVEDGMPAMRALSAAISLTPNHEQNGPLLLVPGSHRRFVACAGETPENHYQQSLRRQDYGVPEPELIARLIDEGGLRSATGPAGSVVLFDCNTLHGSNSNISPDPRVNLFAVYNSVDNRLQDPWCGLPPRPAFVAERDPGARLGD